MATDPAWRPDLYVIARILDALWQPDATHSRASLQRASRLNYDLYRRYLELLVARGLVTLGPDEAGAPVALTPEGLRLHRALHAWLDDFFGGSLL